MNFSNHFLLINAPSYYIPCENIRKPEIGFMMFSASMKREHWEDMGYVQIKIQLCDISGYQKHLAS